MAQNQQDGIWRAIESAGLIAWVCDAENRILWTTTSAAQLLHSLGGPASGPFQADELTEPGNDTLPTAIAAACALASTTEAAVHEVSIIDTEGMSRSLTVSTTWTRLWDGHPQRFVVLEDLTSERRVKRARQRGTLEMMRLATTDPLTGLPNRKNLESQLRSFLRRAEHSHSKVAVLFCDLDGFKQINDTLGHNVGDATLVEVGRRLLRQARHDDVVARLGGDEFVILADDLLSEEMAQRFAQRFIAAFSEPLHVAGQQLNIGMSIGVAFSEPQEAATSVLSRADQAMYRAKRSGAGTAEFAEPSSYSQSRHPQPSHVQPKAG